MSPVARLHGPYFGVTGNPVHFSAAQSFDPDADLVSYEWDFDGNGTTDQSTTDPIVDHTYTGDYTGIAAVRVVSADGGKALASANVTVDTDGLADVAPVAPTAASASATGPGQVTVTWTPAANDHADGYTVRLLDTALFRYSPVGTGNSVTITGIDLSQPRAFSVRAANGYGGSSETITAPVGGLGPETTELVSISTTRAKGNGASQDAYISGDGRYVVFHSDATNLDPADTNNTRDAFVHDRVTGTTSLVSANGAGAVGNGQSDDPAISADGRHVTFRSQAGNLVSGDTNGTAWDIFSKDLQTGAVDRVSVSTAGAQANGASHNPVISGDGRYVVFRSSASNLVTGDTNGQQDLFVRDRQAGTTTRVSVASGGGQATGGASDEPAITADGRYIAFQSDAADLVTGDSNAVTDIFVRDQTAGTTVRVSLDSAAGQSNGRSSDPAISGDGTTVVFESEATNLVAGDTNAKEDIFARVLATGVTVRASVLGGAGDQERRRSVDLERRQPCGVLLDRLEPGVGRHQQPRRRVHRRSMAQRRWQRPRVPVGGDQPRARGHRRHERRLRAWAVDGRMTGLARGADM
jgi:Tol biopolymer transport system component